MAVQVMQKDYVGFIEDAAPSSTAQKDYVGFIDTPHTDININKEVLYSRIKEGAPDEDTARRWSTLYFAEKMGQDPETLNLAAQVKTYFGADVQAGSAQQILNLINQSIEPEEDDNYTKLLELQEKSPEQYIEENNLQEHVWNKKEWYEKERQRLFINSPKALFLASDKILSSEAKNLARRSLIEKDMSIMNWSKLSKQEQEVFPLYMYYLNPAAAENAFPEMVTRIKQAGGRAFEGFRASLEHADVQGLSNEKKLYYAFASRLGRDLKLGGKPLLNDDGTFTSPTAEKAAQSMLDDIYEEEIRGGFNFMGPGLTPIRRSAQLDSDVSKYKANLAESLFAGMDMHKQAGLSRKIKGLAQKRFKSGSLPSQAFMAATEMGVDLAGAMASGVVAGPMGAMAYSAGRFYGDFTETLIHDHKVDATQAKQIAAVATAPYVALEYMQVKGLKPSGGFKPLGIFSKGEAPTPLQKKFAEAWQNGIGPYMKEAAKNYAQEVGEETAQAVIEAGGKAFAKEFAEAQGVEYDQLIKDVGNEFIEAAKGMLVLSGTSTAVRGYKSAREYKHGFSDFDKAEAMIQQAKQEVIETPFISEDKQESIGPELIEEFRNSTDEERAAIAEELDIEVEQIEVVSEIMAEMNSEQRAKIEELNSQRDAALRDISNQVRIDSFQDIYKDSIDIMQQGDEYILIGKNSEKPAQIKLSFNPDKKVDALWRYRDKTIYMGDKVKNPEFSHEITHAMRDLDLINDAEWGQLKIIAEQYHGPEKISKIKNTYESHPEFSGKLKGDDLTHELVAHMIEEVRAGKAQLPLENRSLIQKILDFFKDLISNFSKDFAGSKNTTLQSVYDGKPLQRSAPGRNGDFLKDADKFSIKIDPLAGVIAKEIYKDGLTYDQAIKRAEEAKAEKPEQVVSDAFRYANEVKSKQLDAKSDNQILEAIKEAEIKARYQDLVDQVFKEGHSQGEIFAKAKRRHQRNQQLFRAANIQDLDSTLLDGVIKDFIDALEGDSISTNTFPDLKQNVREFIHHEMVKNKIIKPENEKAYKSTPEFRGSLAKVYKHIADRLIRELTPGAIKQQLKQKAKGLTDYTTLPAIERNFDRLIGDIGKSIIKKEQTELRKDLNKALKPYKKAPKIQENRKSKIDNTKHLFLKYANGYLKLSPENYNMELNGIITEMEKYRDSDQQHEKNKFEELEMRHQALVVFGGLDTARATKSDIQDGIEFAAKVIQDGKQIVNLLEEAHRAKYDPISNDIRDSVEAAKNFIEKKDHAPIVNQLSQMNVRGQLESITAYGTEAQKASLEEILLANDAAKVQKFQMIEEYNNKIIEAAAELGFKVKNNNNVQALINELSKENKKYRKYSAEERTDLSKAELMQLHMSFRQKDIAARATARSESGELSNPDLYRRYMLKDEMIKELSQQEIELAEKMGDILGELLPEVNATYKKQYGVNMRTQEENYFPLKVQTKKGGFKTLMSAVSAAPSFTITRVSNTNDLKERSNIFEVFSAHIEDAAHYIKTYDSQAGIRSTLTNRLFRESVRTAYGEQTLTDIDNSVVDMALDRPLESGDVVREIDTVRSWMSNISIGFNPKSILVAGFGTMNAFATRKGLLSAVSSAMTNPAAVIEDMKFIDQSIVVKKRREQGLNEGMQNARQRAKGNKFIKMYQDAAFYGLTTIDSWVASAFGGIIYNQYKNSEAAAGLTEQQIKENGLAIVNRAIQEAYQPTEADFMPADIRRGGSFAKSFFQFQTEPKSKLGIYFRDIKQIRAEWQKGNKEKAIKDLTRAVIGQHIIIPGAYWLAGEVMRGFSDENWDEEQAIKRLGAGILMGPFSGLLVWGAGADLIVNLTIGNKVFYGSSIPSDRIMNETGFLFKNATSDDEILEKMDKIIERYIPLYKYTKKTLSKN